MNDFHDAMDAYADTPRYRFTPVPGGKLMTREKDGERPRTEFIPDQKTPEQPKESAA